MKRKLIGTAVSMLLLALVAAPAWGQDGEDDQRGRRRRDGERPERVRRERQEGEARRRGGARAGVQARVQKALEELKLDEGKLARVRQVLATHKQAMDNWRKAHATEMAELAQALKAAREAKDREKMRELSVKRRQLAAGQGELAEQLKKQLSEVLEPAQVEAVMGALKGGQRGRQVPLKALLEKLDLSAEQKTRIAAIEEAAKAKAAEAKGRERAKVLAEAQKQALGVLTAEQKAKLQELRKELAAKRPGPESRARGGRGMSPKVLAEAGVAEATIAQITTIMQDAQKQARAAQDREARMKIMREAQGKVDALLTDDQRAKVREIMAKMRGGQRRGERGEGRPPRREGEGRRGRERDSDKE